MRFTTVAVLAGVATVAHAHFQLQFPAPRGVFIASNEPSFCDGYQHAVANRTEFPLSGGFLTLRSGHAEWSLAALISTAQDPVSFDNFTNSSGGQQLVKDFTAGNGAGVFCLPIDLSNTGIRGVENGANVTIQIVYNGGDGSLYQCADLTLSNSATAPPSVTCANTTTPSSSAPGSSSAPAPTAPPSSSTANTANFAIAGLVGLIGAAVL